MEGEGMDVVGRGGHLRQFEVSKLITFPHVNASIVENELRKKRITF